MEVAGVGFRSAQHQPTLEFWSINQPNSTWPTTQTETYAATPQGSRGALGATIPGGVYAPLPASQPLDTAIAPIATGSAHSRAIADN
jgi:hypothetical protein